jgi:hypothetical protein
MLQSQKTMPKEELACRLSVNNHNGETTTGRALNACRVAASWLKVGGKFHLIA